MLFTIGHSTLSEEAFLDALGPVTVLVDVRSHPGSKWPQYRKESLEKALPKSGRQYLWEPHLGGWTEQYQHHREFALSRNIDFDVYMKGKFPKQRIALNEPAIGTPRWYNVGLYDYSWFMAIPEFLNAMDNLLSKCKTQHIAIMCCEVLWWKCHRSMIADYALVRGHDSYHITNGQYKSHLSAIGNRLCRYDSLIKQAWMKHGKQ